MPFRTLPASVSESALPGNTKPTGFKGQGVRAGGAMTWDWYAVFVDTDGNPMPGGTVKVQWYGVDVGAGTYTTPTIGGNPTTPSLQINRKAFGAGLWPWCTVQATPPVVAPKSFYVTVGGFADGTYSIDVVDAGEAASYDATGADAATICAALISDFSSDGLHAEATEWDWILLVSADTPGVDFEIELSSPDDDLTQEPLAPLTPAPATVEIHTTTSAAVEIDAENISEALEGFDFETAAEAGAAAALQAENLSYENVRTAAGEAITSKVADSVIPSDADVDACKPAVLQKYGGQFGDAATENEVISAPSPGNRIAIYGWIATRNGVAMTLELRSGSIGANTAMAGAPAKFTVGGGSAINMTPGTQPLWHGLPDQKIVLQRSAGLLTFEFAVWYRTVPPA